MKYRNLLRMSLMVSDYGRKSECQDIHFQIISIVSLMDENLKETEWYSKVIALS